ncbi:MAG: hypothetical protein Q7T73_10515, partial [Beijerinckiaceae bacterium]|nr:hypothetical protein [Beijerinckiaceae bacterium]
MAIAKRGLVSRRRTDISRTASYRVIIGIVSDSEIPRTERFLCQNLRTVARQGGMEQRRSAWLMHGSFMGLKRTGALPAFAEIEKWARDAGLTPEDVLILKGVWASVEDGEPNLGRLSIQAREDDLVVSMTRDEAFVARQALFLLLYGPFCNTHDRERDSFWETHALTGVLEREFRVVFDALDEQLPPGGST